MTIIKQNQPRRHFTNPNGGRNNRSFSGGRDSTLESSGLSGKIRGTPQQILDKYTNLGRDALSAGDFVTAENFFQYAEHYRRILSPKTDTPSSEKPSEALRPSSLSDNPGSHSRDLANRSPSAQLDSAGSPQGGQKSDPAEPSPETQPVAESPKEADQDVESLPAFLKPRRSFSRQGPGAGDGSAPVVQPLRRRRVIPPKTNTDFSESES